LLIGSIDYIIGFLPCLGIYSLTKLFSTPKDDVDFHKRMLYIQAIILPLPIALLLGFVAVWFRIFIIPLLFCCIYIYSINYLHFTKDQYVTLVTGGNTQKEQKLSNRLKWIKFIAFLCYLSFFAILTK